MSFSNNIFVGVTQGMGSLNFESKIKHFRLEIVGRFPSDAEADDYEVAKTTPVWLPTRQETDQFTDLVRTNLSWLSEWLSGGCKEQ